MEVRGKKHHGYKSDTMSINTTEVCLVPQKVTKETRPSLIYPIPTNWSIYVRS